MSKHRTRILAAGFVVFGMACGTASNPEMGSIGGVAGSAHGSATTGSGSGGDSTEITGAGGVGDSANAGGGTVDTGGGKGEGIWRRIRARSGPGWIPGWDAGPGPMLTGKKFVGNISTRGRITTDFNKYWNQFTPENEGKSGQPNPVKAPSIGHRSTPNINMHSRTTSFSNTTTSFGQSATGMGREPVRCQRGVRRADVDARRL